MVDIENGYAVVRFFSRDDYYHVLEDDPWIVMRHYLTVARWKPNFRPSTDTIISTLDWVHFPEMPIELLTKISYANRNNGEKQSQWNKQLWILPMGNLLGCVCKSISEKLLFPTVISWDICKKLNMKVSI